MIKKFLRTAFRSLRNNAATSSLNIFGLAVGMTAAILIFLWVDNELTFDSNNRDADRIYRLTSHLTGANWTWETTPLQLASYLRSELPAAEMVACFKTGYNTPLKVGNEIFTEKKSIYVDSHWFSLFHYDFLQGDAAAFFRHPFSLILTQSKARKYFGADDPMGQTIRIDSVPYRIAGIIRDIPANSSFQFDVLMPIDASLADSSERKNDLQWGNFNYLTFIKLRPGADSATASKAITSIAKHNSPHFGDDRISLTPLRELHFETDLTSGSLIARTNRKTVYIFCILGCFLLLIACINYVNLTTARATERSKEVGIRKLIGAGRSSLFNRFLFESLTISLLSLAITLLLVQLALPLFRQLTDTNIHAPLSNPDTWKIIGLTLLTATILNGVYPALLLSSFRPLNVIKGRVLMNFKDVYLRKGLVVLQFTFSVILIASTIIIQRQLTYIQHSDPGYDRSQLFTFRIPGSVFRGENEDQKRAALEDIKNQLLSHPGITAVSFASQSLVGLQSSNSGSASWDGHDTAYRPTVFQLSADADFLKTTHIELQQGRWYDPLQATDRHNFILNETAVNLFNIHKPVLGQRFIFQGDTGKIIGILKDFNFASMHTRIAPLAVFNHPSWQSLVYVRTAPGSIPQALTSAHAVYSRYMPDTPFDYDFLDESFDNLYKADTRTASLILIFSAIAILISCLGLLGLAAFTARARVKEIGIRKVLGATVTNIITLLSQDFIKLVLLAVIIATPVAWWAMHNWLQDFAYHIPLNGWTFAVAGGLAIIIAGLTIAVQSLRAARANPVKNLRTD